MGLRSLLYGVYERRLLQRLAPVELPRHIGVILDGNRRWARASGADTSEGHRAGADKILEFLGWCDELDVRVVTLWLLSTDNLSRPAAELAPLVEIIENVLVRIAQTGRYRVHPVGSLDLLPSCLSRTVKRVEHDTRHIVASEVNVAVGYGGRQEITDAVRSLLLDHAARGTTIEALAEVLDVEHIADHLYTRGQPDPELVIRTSGEQRLSGFMLWQSAHSEFYFCEALWPDIRRVDFLRALRSYVDRERRFGA
jgi:short-chain Z-isoprenyl diphosphate synthase